MAKKHGILKKILDSRWAWDFLLGRIYNHLIFKAAADFYREIAEKIHPSPQTHILDVGCGPGYLTLQLAHYPLVAVVGLDHSRRQVKVAEQLRTRFEIKNVTFLQADALSLPFQDACFDVVVSMASLKHWADAGQGLQEIGRVLKPKGLAFIAEADREAPREEIDRFTSGFTAWYVWSRFMRWYHRKIVFGLSYSMSQAQSLARAGNFTQVEIEKAEGMPFFLMTLQKKNFQNRDKGKGRG